MVESTLSTLLQKTSVMVGALMKSVILITIVFHGVGQSSRAGDYHRDLTVDSDTLSNETFYLAASVVKILCDFHANFVHVYFEIGASLDMNGFILSSLNKCGTTFITLGYLSTDQGITIVNDDGITMYMLMIVNDANESVNLSYLRKKSADKHRSFFIVLIESGKLPVGWLYSTFQRFWDLWILNVIVMFWDDGLQIYTYSPFTSSFLKKLPPNTLHKEDLFAMNILNMHRHPLRISLYAEEVRSIISKHNKLKGADGFMANLIAKRLNATKVIVVPDDNYSGEIYGNNTADGSIGYVLRSEVDAGLNTRYLLPDKFRRRVESTHVYGRDDLCVMVPASELQSPIFNLFRSFDRDVWLVVLITPFVVYFTLKLMSPADQWTFLSICSATLSNSMGKIPKVKRFRITVGIFLFYCFFINSFYQGNLTSNIVLPRMTSPINSIKQLVNSPLEILIYKRFAPHIYRYLNSSKAAQLELKKRIQAVTDQYFKARLSANDMTKAYIDKEHITAFRVNTRSHTYRGRKLFRKMNECPVPFYTVYIVPYGSPFLGYINNILRQTQENGIILFWDRVMDINSKLSGKFVKTKKEDDLIVIGMIHLQVAFFILILGFIIAGIVFLLEILLFNKKINKHSNILGLDLSIFDQIDVKAPSTSKHALGPSQPKNPSTKRGPLRTYQAIISPTGKTSIATNKRKTPAPVRVQKSIVRKRKQSGPSSENSSKEKNANSSLDSATKANEKKLFHVTK